MSSLRDKVNIAAGLSIVAFLLGALIYQHSRPPGPNKSDEEFMRHMAGPAQVRAWRPVVKTLLRSDAVEVSEWIGWSLPAFAGGDPRGQARAFLSGQFAAGGEKIVLGVMDGMNYGRLQAGYPPMFLYTAEPGAVRTAVPFDGFFYGFFRVPPPESAEKFPTSLSELALLLVRKGIEQPRPPAKVSLDFNLEFECFCTPQEQMAEVRKVSGQ